MFLCFKISDPNPAMVEGNTGYTDCYRDVMTFCGGKKV